ncbi:type II TA system antitoxin MqsA family protein [Scopulibacillus cellulosilyticus]|uniref:Type II TA system antitoxin MqsA family protein n=1 Tax=Scopulibacillus cellulosilyticus TaxID=2665665 RepID=A0ABW2PXM4_9BACL
MLESTRTKYCDNCRCDVEAKIVERNSTYTFKGETFEINERVLICSCGEELYDEVLDSETMKILTRMYEERIGLSLKDIKTIRNQYGLSMELFARILGWSKSTIVRYETGKYIPDSSHMTILKRLKDHPEVIDEYYKLNKHKFNEKEQEKINKKLSNTDEIKVEKSLVDTLNVNYKLNEKTIESGYSSFNLNKLINMVLFLPKRVFKKTN